MTSSNATASVSDYDEPWLLEHRQLFSRPATASSTVAASGSLRRQASATALHRPRARGVAPGAVGRQALVGAGLLPAFGASIDPEDVIALAETIRRSHRLVSLQPDLDTTDDLPIAAETWRRATAVLQRLSFGVLLSGSGQLVLPTITAADRRSVELYWSTPKGQLLLNVPADPAGSPSYAWRGAGEATTSGVVDTPTATVRLMEWLQALA